MPPSARADTQGSLSAPLSSPKVLRIETKRKPSDAVATSLKREPASDASISASRWDNFRSCPRCTYVFCVQCRGTWHGAHTPCSIRDAEAAVKEYLEEDDEGKAAIELRLGPRNAEALRALVRDYEREQLVLSWISENTTPCPCCSVPIQKRYVSLLHPKSLMKQRGLQPHDMRPLHDPLLLSLWKDGE